MLRPMGQMTWSRRVCGRPCPQAFAFKGLPFRATSNHAQPRSVDTVQHSIGCIERMKKPQQSFLVFRPVMSQSNTSENRANDAAFSCASSPDGAVERSTASGYFSIEA